MFRRIQRTEGLQLVVRRMGRTNGPELVVSENTENERSVVGCFGEQREPMARSWLFRRIERTKVP